MPPLPLEDIARLKADIRALSEFNAFSSRDLALHFQTLISGKANKIFMEAPGLFYPDIPLYVVSKSGLNRGHTSMHNSILPILPKDRHRAVAFVLYPESLIRTCFDRVLRNTAKKIGPNLRISMENVFNRKHYSESLVGTEIEQQLIERLKSDLQARRFEEECPREKRVRSGC